MNGIDIKRAIIYDSFLHKSTDCMQLTTTKREKSKQRNENLERKGKEENG